MSKHRVMVECRNPACRRMYETKAKDNPTTPTRCKYCGSHKLKKHDSYEVE